MGAQACSGAPGGRARAPTHGDVAGSYTNYSGPPPKGKWFTNSPDGEMPPRFADTGLASEKEIPASTVPKMFQGVAAKHPNDPALAVERPCPDLVEGKPPPTLPYEQWTKWTYNEMLVDINKAAQGFIHLGFKPYETVNIWGFNSPEWVMGAMAASFAGGKVGGLYPTDTADTAAYKVVHSGGSIVLYEDKGKLDKLLKGLKERGDCKRIRAFIAWGYKPDSETQDVPKIPKPVPHWTWAKLMEEGSIGHSDVAANKLDMDKRIAATTPGNCCGLIYTSGTTGDPKAVMISHDNLIYEASCVVKILGKSTGLGLTATQERVLSYLPLSHVAGMMLDIACPLAIGQGPAHATTFFARPYDLKAGSFANSLKLAKPTVFLGVPLVWEKVADKLRAIGAANTGLKAKIGAFAKGKALQRAKEAQVGHAGTAPWGVGLADKVLVKIKEQLGLDQCKFGLTGAAPIRVDTLEYFGSLGIQINEVYGMSECTGACTWSLNDAHEWGSCGWELPGVEVRAFKVNEKDFNVKTECPKADSLEEIDEKFMGELCFRGRNNMMGYMACPDMDAAHQAEIAKKTAETIDNEGWLHSGDKGMITARGMVKITGRYKELIIGEGGENIAPVPIEDFIKKLCDGVAEVMMIGDKRKYNVAIITLKAVGANGEVPGTDALEAGAKRVNPEVQTISGAMEDQTWLNTIQKAIDDTNKNTKVVQNNAFSIQKWTIVPHNFSEEAGELTPTKKLKRKSVETNYKQMIDKLYSTEGKYIKWVK